MSSLLRNRYYPKLVAASTSKPAILREGLVPLTGPDFGKLEVAHLRNALKNVRKGLKVTGVLRLLVDVLAVRCCQPEAV